MATPFQPIAVCVARWIYEQASWVLQKLKEGLLWLIERIDNQILLLRAWLAQGDVVARFLAAKWDAVKEGIEYLKSQISDFVEGPSKDICPEFVTYFTDPFVSLLDQFLNSVGPLQERALSALSYMDDIDRMIAYWDNTKNNLVAIVDVIDAALYEALLREANDVP